MDERGWSTLALCALVAFIFWTGSPFIGLFIAYMGFDYIWDKNKDNGSDS